MQEVEGYCAKCCRGLQV